jgi:hypothetical protein
MLRTPRGCVPHSMPPISLDRQDRQPPTGCWNLVPALCPWNPVLNSLTPRFASLGEKVANLESETEGTEKCKSL